MTGPRVDRPRMPEGYGVEQATDYISWEQVESMLVDSAHYWLSTTRSDGRPHVVPRWGVWLDGRFWYDGSSETIHVKNLGSSGSCVLHLESGKEVVIVEGASLAADPIGPELGGRLAAEYARKYSPDYTPGPDSWSDEIAGGMRRLVPKRVLAWTEFPNNLTRFTFEE